MPATETRLCEWCSLPFHPYVRGPYQKFCCSCCRSKANESLMRAKKRERKVCPVCECAFWPSLKAGNKQIFCCLEHKNRAGNLRRQGRPIPRCGVCNKPVFGGRRLFCSQGCQDVWRAERQRTPRYRGVRNRAQAALRVRRKAKKLEKRARLAALFRSAPAPHQPLT